MRSGGGEAKLWSALAYRSHPGSNPLEKRRHGMELHGKPVWSLESEQLLIQRIYSQFDKPTKNITLLVIPDTLCL